MAPQRYLPALMVALLVANVGFGITLTVLPFHVKHLSAAHAGMGAIASAAAQIGALTAVYPTLQVVAAPAWGRLSDRIGRRVVLLAGMTGAAASYIMFATQASLAGLYTARAIAGLFAAAVASAAAAYVADATPEATRRRALAWTGGAATLGAIAGAALGGVLTEPGMTFHLGRTTIVSGFSLPFVVAAALALIALAVLAVCVPPSSRPSRSASVPSVTAARVHTVAAIPSGKAQRGDATRLLLVALVAQFALAMFETTFPLYTTRMWGQAPSQIGLDFAVCGAPMVVGQLAVVPLLDDRVTGRAQVMGGFVLVAVSMALLPITSSLVAVRGTITVLGLGLGVLAPNIVTEISRRAPRSAEHR